MSRSPYLENISTMKYGSGKMFLSKVWAPLPDHFDKENEDRPEPFNQALAV
jgi:hypothetical protein